MGALFEPSTCLHSEPVARMGAATCGTTANSPGYRSLIQATLAQGRRFHGVPVGAPAARWTASSQGLLAVTWCDLRLPREASLRRAAPIPVIASASEAIDLSPGASVRHERCGRVAVPSKATKHFMPGAETWMALLGRARAVRPTCWLAMTVQLQFQVTATVSAAAASFGRISAPNLLA